VAGSGVSLFSPLPAGGLSGSPAGAVPFAWGSALLAGVLSFASPKESSQRKSDPRVGAGFAGPLRYSAGRAAAELGASPLKQSSPKAPGQPALLSASQGDPKSVSGPNAVRRTECYGRPKKRAKNEKPPVESGWFTGPLERRRVTQTLAEKGRGLSEAQRAEFRSPRQRRVTQGTGVAGADPGSPFLCLLSFGEAKESKTPLKGGKPRFSKPNAIKCEKHSLRKAT
jgi:hypothetical protein